LLPQKAMISLDLWRIVEEMLPLLQEIERIEAMAAEDLDQEDLSDIRNVKQ
jgi:hypothetical protein